MVSQITLKRVVITLYSLTKYLDLIFIIMIKAKTLKYYKKWIDYPVKITQKICRPITFVSIFIFICEFRNVYIT